jgi:glycosyltransferase involved in cell wall biosynthesis
MKCSGAGSSYMDRREILKKIHDIKKTVPSRKLPNIYLLHGEFTNEEMSELYNHPKVKAMVNLTKGERYGRPLLEFSLVNKPIISTNWSGHIDFLNQEFTALCGGQLNDVHPSARNEWIVEGSKWFDVDLGNVGFFLNDVFDNYKKYKNLANRQGYVSRTNFSFEKMKFDIDSILSESVPEFPKQIEFKLPELKLPKLKKVEA